MRYKKGRERGERKNKKIREEKEKEWIKERKKNTILFKFGQKYHNFYIFSQKSYIKNNSLAGDGRLAPRLL